MPKLAKILSFVCNRALTLLLLFSLASCSSLIKSANTQGCGLRADEPYDVVEIDLERHAVRLFWKLPDGTPFLTLERLQTWVTEQGYSLIAATNAGIFEPGYIPSGLFIEDGEVKNPLNLSEGRGNFYLKPNGVFFLTGAGAYIVESSRFESMSEPVRYAVQSGPLLVSAGVIHPRFTPGSKNCRLRSGVGVDADGTVYLVISNGTVNFYDFSIFFRDQLSCPDALYLDGAISELYAPTLGRVVVGQEKYAGILGVMMKE